jgi:putative oxidoreductase
MLELFTLAVSPLSIRKTTGRLKMINSREPTPVFPGLRGFYERMIPVSWLLVRLGVGWNLAYHGYGKILRGMTAQTKALDITVPYLSTINLPLSYVLTFVEGLGGLCIMLGLFTRFFAAANAIEMAFLTFVVYWGNGFGWLGKGYEYTLMWGVMCLAIALRGGGPLSLDRLLGKEL